MGRRRKTHLLDVYVGRSRVGTYTRQANLASAFRYHQDWLASDRSFPISLSIPLSDRIWTGNSLAAVFDGLLPDSRTVRETIARREGADSAATFDLLAAIGRDCVGALRFIPEGTEPGDPTTMRYRSIDDDEIASRLASLGTSPLGILTDEEDDFRISIAGMQEKTAYLLIEGWQVPQGVTPTSHIFKPAMREGPKGVDFSDSPWNEWFCLTLCRELGLPTAKAEVRNFENKPVIIGTRFDRRWQNEILYRLPQEDMCQAFGVLPSQKYETDGGPGILEILKLLNQSAVPRLDRLTFFKTQIVFWLIAAIDGHAKNFSVFLTPSGFSLTPLYDVMSAEPYPQLSRYKRKLAMAVGDNRHYRIAEIAPRHFYQTGSKAGITAPEIDEIFQDLCRSLEPALSTATTAAQAAGMPAPTMDAIVGGIRDRAALMTESA